MIPELPNYLIVPIVKILLTTETIYTQQKQEPS